MAHCVYGKDCKSKALLMFKGRLFCDEHLSKIRTQLLRIIDEIERREHRRLSKFEQVGINNPRHVVDRNGRILKIRGQHFTISMAMLDTISLEEWSSRKMV